MRERERDERAEERREREREEYKDNPHFEGEKYVSHAASYYSVLE